jgi:hypothetical protein
MSLTSNLVTLVALVGAASVAAAFLKANLEGRAGEAKFKAKPLLTANELEFFGRLEAAVPELRFCPQVAMGALIDPAVPVPTASRTTGYEACSRKRSSTSWRSVARTDRSSR